MFTITLEEQEVSTENYDFFNIPPVITQSFAATFGINAPWIVIKSLNCLREMHPDGGLDYLQVFTCIMEPGNEVIFYAVNDSECGEICEESHVTFMLPSDY